MKLTIVQTCYVHTESYDPVPLLAGDTVDIAEQHARAAIIRGLAIPFVTPEDVQTNAPPREKHAMRGSPERH